MKICPKCGSNDLSLAGGWKSHVPGQFYQCRECGNEIVPLEGDELDSYKINKNTNVTIFETPEDIKYLYFLNPPEFKLSEDKYELLDLAKRVLIGHKPKAEEFTDTERTRQVFLNISKDLLQDLAQSKGIRLNYSDLNMLSRVLVRHTIGFGIIELLLQDKKG